MPHRIIRKFESLVVPTLVRSSTRAGWPGLTAAILSATVRPLGRGGQYRVLCLRRSIFIEDLGAMSKYSGQLEYLLIERRYLWAIVEAIVPDDLRAGMLESNYHHDPKTASARAGLHDYWVRLLPILKQRLGFQAVFSGNIGYREQQELMRVCEEQRVPFIVLHKEGMAVQSLYPQYAKIYAHHILRCAKILFYNERIRKALFDIGLSGLTPEKAAVVGIPRLDAYFRPQFPRGTIKHVAFFSFFPIDKFRYQIADQATLDRIEERSRQFHALVFEFAGRHPDITITVKTKVSTHYLDYVRGIPGYDLPNLIVTNAVNPTALIEKSQVVIGFNSTTLIEAIIADRLVVTPDFGDIITGQDWDYFRQYPELVKYARTVADLENYLGKPQNYLASDRRRKTEFLTELMHTPDGQASRRAEEAIIETIHKYATH